jgi:hypothetical protein
MTIPVPAAQNEESVNDISKHEVASASNGAAKSDQGEAVQAPSFLNERSRGLEIDGSECERLHDHLVDWRSDRTTTYVACQS